MNKVSDVTCMFCSQAPCTCNTFQKKKPAPRAVAAKVEPVAEVAQPPEPAPPVPQRRLSALDRMRAGITATAGRALMPAKPSEPRRLEDPTPAPVPAVTAAHSPAEPLYDPIFDVAIANLMPLLGPEYQGKGKDNIAHKANQWRKKVSKE